MRRLLCVAALAVTDAAAKFALEKKGQKVLNVKLYETGYTFTNRGDKEKKPQTLREISGCSFGKKRDNGRRDHLGRGQGLRHHVFCLNQGGPF